MSKPLHVTDHALVRYCERVLGLDRMAVIDGLRATLTPFSDGRHKLPGMDVVAVIKDGAIVTFIATPQPVEIARKPVKNPKAMRPMDCDDSPWLKR